MKKEIKGILINVHDRSVKAVVLKHHGEDHVGLKEMHELIGCDCFTCVDFDHCEGPITNSVYVDDEGLLKDPKEFFMIPGYHQWLAGNGLILGVDESGESVDTTLTVEQVEQVIKFGRIK